MSILIADSGATKCQWCLCTDGKKKMINTIGISPYFLSIEEIVTLIQKEVVSKVKSIVIEKVFFYGTGLSNINNKKIIEKALLESFGKVKIEVNTDILGAARALFGKSKGVACILGTGSNSCYYNGKKIISNRPGLGYVLGDEGSGAYLGKKVLQHFLYETFDEDLANAFNKKFNITRVAILDEVYKKPFPSKYLASFATFLSENRGHFMVENIIEDGLYDFYFQHLFKFKEVWLWPVSFVGSVAYGFKDVLENLCQQSQLQLGTILKEPMAGLIQFHKSE